MNAGRENFCSFCYFETAEVSVLKLHESALTFQNVIYFTTDRVSERFYHASLMLYFQNSLLFHCNALPNRLLNYIENIFGIDDRAYKVREPLLP